VSFAHSNVVPHIAIPSSRLRLAEFETVAAKRLLQHYRHKADMLNALTRARDPLSLATRAAFSNVHDGQVRN
jgi:hypothetical protein